jgi:structural maintenance of chromosomes protein 6
MKLMDAETNRKSCLDDLRARERLLNEAKADKATAQQKVTTATDKVAQLNEIKKSALMAFHPKMEAVLKEIQSKRSQFTTMPIGPLGAFVKIKKEQWAGICEVVFGRGLNGFICSHAADLKILEGILKGKNWYRIAH